MLRKYLSFYVQELLVPRPTPQLEGRPLSAARDCLLNVFAALIPPTNRGQLHAVTTGHL
jgi:hypothetical protein